MITGALPAQYGFQQAGVVDIQTKIGITDPGGEIAMYGGTRGVIQPSFSYGGRSGAIDYFVTGDYLHTGIGIENPTNKLNAIHDDSDQFHGLVHISGIVNPTTRVSLTAGTSNSIFQIPNKPGVAAGLGLAMNGVTDFNSANFNQRQRESTQFAILSLQKQLGDVDFQISAFSRYSRLYYSPDPLGDLLFNGITQRASRQDFANGVQGDGSWRVDDRHTIRAGFLVQAERTSSSSISSVLPVDNTGAPTSDQPCKIYSGSGKTGGLYGIYLQEECKILPTVTVNYGARFDVVDQFTRRTQVW